MSGAGMGVARQFDVVVMGAGVIGATMASLLMARNLTAPGRVAIIADRFAPRASIADSEWDLRVFALGRASQRLLDLCGAWAGVAPAKICAYDRMRVWDARGEPRGAGSLTFDCAELGEGNLGHIIEGRALQTECLRAAGTAGVVPVEAALEAVAIDDGAVRLRLSDGREIGCQLLIAADGLESKTRELLGIDTAGHSYHQDALVAHVRTAQPHEHTAWQRFLATGPLAFLPLPDGRSSIVWSVARTEAERLRALDAADFGRELTAASGGALGACELTTPVASFPLKLQYALDYVRPRAVLVGDAAHVVHPLAGQGLNLGLLDCATLADVLGQSGAAGFYGEQKLLRRYERRRRSENLAAATALDGLDRVFSNDDPVRARLRMGGLGAANRSRWVKRLLAERALGLAGDLPAFLRAGQPWRRR